MKLIPLVDMTPQMLLQGRLTANTNGTGIATKAYDGPAIVITNAHNVAGTSPTCDIAFKESATVGGTYTAHAPAAAITQVTTTDSLQLTNLGDIGEWMDFIRAEFTIGGSASPSYDLCCILVAQLKYK